MSINIDLEKVNYKKFVNRLMENKKVNNKDLLEKIILQFGNLIGDELILLHNEYYEDGICTWNMCKMIDEVFGLNEINEDSYNIYLSLRENMITYKEIDEAYEDLNLEREEKDYE